MEEKLYGSVPYPSEYLQQWIQSAQQLQAIQAQYSGFNPLQQQQPHYPVGQVAPQNLKQPHYPTVGQAAENHQQHQYPVRQQQAPENRPQYPVAVGQAEERPVPNMPANPGTLQQEPADLTKPPAKKRGRQAQPKEPKPPKIPKAPKPPKAPKEPKPPKEAKPKAKPGPKSKKAKEGEADGSQPKVDETFKKVRRKVDRFKGMSEEEVMTKTLPDLLEYNLDYVIIGINPGLMAAFIGRWFPGPGNHFWKCLFLSGFTDELLNHTSDTVLPGKYKIGFTNMVARATPGSKDLSTKELREGGVILTEKLVKYKPLIAVFNGKCIYEMFCREMFGKKPKTLQFGLQPHKIPDCDVALYLMPSSSARCAQFPRAQDKVHFYIKLRELRDTLKGVQKAKEIEEVHYSFDLGLAKEDAKRMAIKEEQYDPGYEDAYGGAYALPGAAEAAGPPQTNGHCKFSDAENTGSSDKATTSQTDPPAEGNLPDIQMSQSFTDQIPDIAGGPTEASV